MSSAAAADSLPASVAQLDIHDVSTDASADVALDTDTGMAPAPAHTPTDTPAVRALRSLLRQTLRVTILDGRVFLGTFAGTDKLLNILLVNTDEFVTPANARAYARANPDGRFVGLVQIPWRLVVRVEAHRAQEADGEDEREGAVREGGSYGGYDPEDMLYA